MSFSISKNKVRGGIIATAAIAALCLIPVTASGAWWQASDNGHATTQTGSLTIELGSPEDGMSGTFDLQHNNLIPGSHVDDVFYVKNTGSIPAKVSMTDRTVSNTAGAALTGSDWEYFRTGVAGYSTQVKSNVGLNADLGVLQPGETKAYTLRKSLEADAGDNWQNVTVGSNIVVTLDQIH